MMSTEVSRNYREVLERAAKAAQRAGRRPDAITLVAVTKSWPAEVVVTAYEAGMRHFGENRIEELAAKKTAIAGLLGVKDDMVWHQIGTVQSRKSNLVADQANVFHALDRPKIAERLAKRLQETGRALPAFLEVNISQEAGKSGLACGDWEENATSRDNLRNVVETIAALPGLQLRGLMTMAPWGAGEAVIRRVFQRTRELAEWLGDTVPQASFEQLSMGMSDDFEIAIEEGATHIRVGRAIFGARH